EEPGQRRASIEYRSAGRTVETKQLGHDLVRRQREIRLRPYRREWVLRRYRERGGADRLVERQPAGCLQQRLVRYSLVVDAIAATQGSLVVAEDIPGETKARRDIVFVEAVKQSAIADAGSSDLRRVLRM